MDRNPSWRIESFGFEERCYWSRLRVSRQRAVGETIATIIPDGKITITGRMYIPSSGFGRVKEGQSVNIKLNGYPYMEYGILKGVIKSVSAVPDRQKGYVADVRFTNDLTTTYGKKIDMIQQMDGQAEIIIEDSRLLQRFFKPIKALFKAR